VEIFSILIFQSRMNFAYKRDLCQEMKRRDVKPNENILRRIEQSIAHAKRMVFKKVQQTMLLVFSHHLQETRTAVVTYHSCILA